MRSIDLIILIVILISDINGETEPTISNAKEDTNHRSTPFDYWKNHKLNVDSLYAKYRDGKSNIEPYFSEPNNNNDQYETMPNTIQITAIPGGVGGVLPTGISGFPGTFGLGQFGGFGGLGGWGGHGGWTTHGWPSHGQYKGPIYVINKKSDYFSWLIPLLLLLGAPLLFGLALIPLALKSIIYILQICRNLGLLLPLIPIMTNPNPTVPTTG